MRTENGVTPSGQRAHKSSARRLAMALVLVLVSAVLVSPAAGQSGGDEPPWDDLEEASRRLADAQVRVLDARDSLEAAQANLDRLWTESEDIAATTLRIAEELNARQTRAISLAVEAYIAGGPLSDSLFVLDSDSANDFAYRSVLLTESAEAVALSQDEYWTLRDEASEEAVALADRIGLLQEEIIAAEQELVEAEAAIPDAEWVVVIAEINRAAHEQIERFGRQEPTEEQWESLRFCEAGGVYTTSTGNGYYGAYQFDVTTWIDMGGSGLPSDAPPEEQDARALYLYGLRGSGYGTGGSWPVCGRYLPD